MISLEKLGDGSTTARNFDKLAQLVVETGGLSVGVRFGTGTATFPGGSAFSGYTTIEHGLGRAPAVVFVVEENTGVATYGVRPGTTTDTEFQTRARQADGSSPAAAAESFFNWLVIG